LFVSASPDYGTTQALVEALAAGLPIVASDTQDAREVVDDGIHGYLVPSGDGRQMSERISQLFEATELALQFGLAARRRANECYSLSRVVDDHIKLFKQLVYSASRGTA
jgi:glycosyltransferase involved in cell wall biosynthesis